MFILAPLNSVRRFAHEKRTKKNHQQIPTRHIPSIKNWHPENIFSDKSHFGNVGSTFAS
jgi:ribosomal protein L3